MIQVIAQFQTTLTSGISATATGGTLESNASADADGTTIPNGDYGIVIDEDNNRREYATITLNGFDFTFIKRGLSMIDGDTVKTGNKFSHRKGAVVKITNHPALTLMVNIFNGVLPLTGILYNDAARSYTSDFQLVDKKYVDDIAIAGSPKASETVYGIAKLSSAASNPLIPIVLNSEEVSATSAANKVVRANSSGFIDKGFIEVTANKGLIFSTNALQVKPGTGITVDSSGVNVDVGTTNGKIVQMTTGDKLPAVDGSNLTNLPIVISQKNFTSTRDISASSGAVTYAHGLGYTPNWVKVTALGVQGTSIGKFDASGQRCVYSQVNSTPTNGLSNTTAVYLTNPSGSNFGVITVDSTNVTITWTKTGAASSNDWQLLFEAGK